MNKYIVTWVEVFANGQATVWANNPEAAELMTMEARKSVAGPNLTCTQVSKDGIEVTFDMSNTDPDAGSENVDPRNGTDAECAAWEIKRLVHGCTSHTINLDQLKALVARL